MTGTAKTEEEEFYKIYHLEVLLIPTNKPIARIDRGDLLFRSEKGKFDYIVNLIWELHKEWQPILVGTVNVAKSEYLSSLLEKKWIPHEVLNAKQDSREAEIIAKAGQYGSVTIATNMAGRGTDIKIDDRVRTLSWVVKLEGAAWTQEYPLGWLFVIGTEKHETRRIDNQLRGRSGRQWDPGLSQFMLSPQDDIMRIFGGNRLFAILASFESHPEADPLIESKTLMKNITTIQKQVEGRNFDIRKHILEYDDVLNHHRLAIYSRRNRILSWSDIHADILEMIEWQATRIVEMSWYAWETEISEDTRRAIVEWINDFSESDIAKIESFHDATWIESLVSQAQVFLTWKIETLRNTGTEEEFAEFERRLTLAAIDELWMQHIDRMAHLREEVAFEWYAQKNPLVVYKERAYHHFVEMIGNIEYRVIKWLLTAKAHESIDEVNLEENLLLEYTKSWIEKTDTSLPAWFANGHSPKNQSPQKEVITEDLANEYVWTSRNDPCPCWSGKKYKHCHWK